MNNIVVPNKLITLNPSEFVQETYSPFVTALAEAQEQIPQFTYDIATSKGMETAKSARKLFKDIRIALEKKRAEAKAPILEIGKLLDSKAKELSQKIESHENIYDADIKSEESRIEAEKQAKILAEKQRQESIQKRIDDLRNCPSFAINCSSAEIESRLAGLVFLNLMESDFDDRVEEARFILKSSIEQMQVMMIGKQAQEELARVQENQRLEQERIAKERAEQERIHRSEEDAKRKAEQEELARQRAELAAQAKAIADAQAKLDADKQAALDAETAKQLQSAQDAEEANAPATEIPPIIMNETPKLRDKPSDFLIIRAVVNSFHCSQEEAKQWIIEAAANLKV